MHLQKIVLIVDDSDINRKILVKMLEKEYRILEAANGEEAFETINNSVQPISAVLLDLLMPVMDGYRFLQIAADDERYKNIPIIVSTGNSDKENEKTALELGAWDFVSKPYDADIVKFRLKNVITRSQLSAFEQLKYVTEFDSVTGLYNKSKFFTETRNMLRADREQKYVFFRVDISRFSLINAYYGMEEGDRLLRYIADRLREMERSYSKMTYGRTEGDEFAVCIAYTDKKRVDAILEHSKKQFKNYRIKFNIVPIYGIYYITDHDMPIDTMLDNANLAAKRVKGNYINIECVYTEDMRQSLSQEQSIVNEMNEALEQEQFVVYLQPKYSLRSNTPAGAEALVRWLHPKKGMISPGVFIPVFERNGFIEKLDYYMWEHTCMILKKWIDEGKRPLPVSVNVSRVNLYNPYLVVTICGLADKYRIPHALLHLEITESAYTDNQTRIMEIIEELHANDFVALMDDFGSGYSSLNILKDVEVDIIKIDMKFFEKSKDTGRSECIVSSVVRMAKWLNITVIAEGVEKLEQVEFLRSIGCEYVQGYYFAKPMPVAEYEALVDKFEVYVEEADKEITGDKTWILNREMQQMLSSVMQPIGIYEIRDNQVECIKVNSAFYETFGYEDELLYSEMPLKVVDWQQREEVLRAVKTAIANKGEQSCEFLRHCLNGKEIWVRLNIRYIDSVGGKDIVLGSFIDITQQRITDEVFQKYKSHLQAKRREYISMLIVDDIELNREMIREIFSEKYHITTAENGQDAIEKIRASEEGIDIIILDMMMPVMDGTQFLEYKKTQKDLKDIPVIVFTADDSPKMQKNTLALGADDYITKPFVREVIEKRIKNVLESRWKI